MSAIPNPSETINPLIPANANHNHLSPSQLKKVARYLVACEIGYAALCLSTIALLLSPLQSSDLVVDIAVICAVGSFVVTWIALVLLALHSMGAGGGLFALAFSVPILGIVAFFELKKYAIRFMQRNGYRPCFIGVEIDPDQIEAMAADPHYTPCFDVVNNRTKLKKIYTASNYFTQVVVVVFIALVIYCVYTMINTPMPV